MRKIWVLVVLAGCSAQPVVNWPAGPVPAAPPLLPLEQVLAAPQG